MLYIEKLLPDMTVIGALVVNDNLDMGDDGTVKVAYAVAKLFASKLDADQTERHP